LVRPRKQMMKKTIYHNLLLLLSCILMFPGIVYAKGYTEEQITVTQEQAEKGITDAQIDLGLIYYNGDGVSKDKSMAAHWFLKAAEQGHADAQHYIAWMYARGEGLVKDKSKALFWYLKSAENNHIDSQVNLANIYMKGDDVKKKYMEASFWYKKAAEQGSQHAQYELAVMYRLGEGVEQSNKKAKELFLKAAAQGNKNAEKALVMLDIEAKSDEYSQKRMNNVYLIASLLEEYKTIANHYPFYDPTPVKEGYVKTGTLVTLASPAAEEQLAKKPNPFGISAARAYSSHLSKELEEKLERTIKLPVDPQKVAMYAPNAYYVYFPPADDDEYMVISFLYSSNAYTTELFNSHANVYAITSSPIVSEKLFWTSAGIKPRIFKNIVSIKK
jgi:Sel1 repeat